ncbi:MAG: chorismate pyruvate-lyase family protein [Myxococcota bacterium]
MNIEDELRLLDQTTGLDDWNIDPEGDILLRSPEQHEDLDSSTLTPFHRVLLEIDGTVTKFLESQTKERIDVLKVSQAQRSLPRAHEWLRAPAGTTVSARQVILCGHDSHELYAYAVSLLVPERMPAPIREELQASDKGIGRLLREHRLETYREVLWTGRERRETLPPALARYSGGGLVSRTYRVLYRGAPIMLIHEKFPIPDTSS